MAKPLRHYAYHVLSYFDNFGLEELKKQKINVPNIVELSCRAIQRKQNEIDQLKNDIDRMEDEVICLLLQNNLEKDLEQKLNEIAKGM